MQGKDSALPDDRKAKAPFLAAKVVEAQGKGSVVAAKEVETPAKGGVLPATAFRRRTAAPPPQGCLVAGPAA